MDCEVLPTSICDKVEDGRYYPSHAYTFQGDRVLIADSLREVEALAVLNPINESSSDAYWRNDTMEVLRVCPPTVPLALRQVGERGPATGHNITLFGFNFPTLPGALVCLWEGKLTYLDGYQRPFRHRTVAQAESEFVCHCPTPRLIGTNVDVGGYVEANVTLQMVGGSPTGAVRAEVPVVLDPTLEVNATDALVRAAYGSCELQAGEGQPAAGHDLNRWFELRGLSMAKLSFDFAHLPEEFVYGEHFTIAIYVDQSVCTDARCDVTRTLIPNTPETEHLLETTPCKHPVELPRWFIDPSVPKNQAFSISVTALEDVKIHIEAHILYGLFLPMAPQLVNTTTVQVMSPSRANMTFGLRSPAVRELPTVLSSQRKRVPVEYSFMVSFSRDYMDSIITPLNLPPRFRDTERGRVLVDFDARTVEATTPWITDPESDVREGPEYWEKPSGDILHNIAKYREVWHETIDLGNGEAAYQWSRMVLPYMPFFSSCKGFDNHIPLFALLEDDACELPDPDDGLLSEERYNFPPMPHPDDTYVAGPMEVFQSPIADVCSRTLQCRFEENLQAADIRERWFEVPGDTALFEILRSPVSLEDFYKNGDLLDSLLLSQGIDVFVPVSVDRSAAEELKGDCTTLCFPRSMTLDIPYYQVNYNEKRILAATLVLEDFDRDSSNSAYELSVAFYPLGWLDLVIAFAFNVETFIVLFVVIGLLSLAATTIYWSLNRLLTRQADPPQFRFFHMLSVVVPPPTLGITLALVPLAIVLSILFFILRGDELFFSVTVLDSNSAWFLDGVVGHWMQSKVDIRLKDQYRRGRMGLGFLTIAMFMMVLSARIYIPKPVSVKEQRLAQASRYNEQVSTWLPTLWKRSNFIFCSLMFSFFLVLITEFSFWEGFGDYIWYIIFIYKFVDIAAGVILESQLQDSLLLTPFGAAFGIIQALVTLGSDDFQDFVIVYFIEFGLMIADRVYIGPGLDAVIDWLVDTATSMHRRVLDMIQSVTALTLQQEVAREERQAKGLLAPEPPPVEEGSEETVEPIVDAFAGYSMEVVSLFFNPVLILMMIAFRDEMGIPELYGIKAQDMEYYFWFSVVILFFQLACDMFLHNVLELFHGWKIHDYLVFVRFHFNERRVRWVGMDDQYDEALDEGIRTLHQMGFSSQYYFMSFIHVTGMVLVVLGIEAMMRVSYNFFGDPATLLLVPFLWLLMTALQFIAVFLADKFGLWSVKRSSGTGMADSGDGDWGIPSLSELMNLQRRKKGSSYSSWQMNAKLSSDTFRFKFLDYNRAWLVYHLPEILTPRTVQRARPRLIAQFARMLGLLDEGGQELSGEEDGGPERKFGDVALSGSDRAVLRWWLNTARRRLAMRGAAAPIIRRSIAKERARHAEAVDVLMGFSMDQMDRMFQAAYPDMEELDLVAWKSFFAQRQTYKAVPKGSAPAGDSELLMADMLDSQEQQASRFGPVFLSPTSKRLLLVWYNQARMSLRRRSGRRQVVRRTAQAQPALHEEHEDTPEWAKGPLQLSPATAALARKWLQLARFRRSAPQRRTDGRGVAPSGTRSASRRNA